MVSLLPFTALPGVPPHATVIPPPMTTMDCTNQLTSLSRIFGIIVYFICSTLSYHFVFDKATFSHPKFLKNQVRQEISQSLFAHPFMSMLTAPFFVLEAQGYSKLYDDIEKGPGKWYLWAQFPLFILFTDCLIYFIHRGLHHPILYRRLHKPHHKWIMPTPYASHAFHPVDGWMQSIPYHMFPFLFPMQKLFSVAVFAFVNIWTVFIRTFPSPNSPSKPN